MKFIKMHGLGNDFVILDHRNGGGRLAPETIRKLADRQFGVGCDQVIVLEPSKKADVFMRIYNPDASEAESCGNATRCVAHLLGKDSVTIETRAGLLPCRRVGDLIEADMGAPKGEVRNLAIGGKDLPDAVAVNMGNPHCVFFVGSVEDTSVEMLGPIFEHHELFPDRSNVEFAQVIGDNFIRLRVWERGAGVTLACGSGACATIVAAVSRGLTGRRAEVIMDGGPLTLEWRESDSHVLMTGPVAYVFEGEFINEHR
jgi:diaminopimelate epimerase